jgi:hypothetical protein
VIGDPIHWIGWRLFTLFTWQQARFAIGFGFELVFFFAFFGQFFLALFESVIGCGQDGSFSLLRPM